MREHPGTLGSVSRRAARWAKAIAFAEIISFHTAAYADEQQAPSGFHVEHRPRFWLVIPGVLIAGLGAILVDAGVSGIDDAKKLRDHDDRINALQVSHAITDIGVAHVVVGTSLTAFGFLLPEAAYVRDKSVRISACVGREVGGELTIRF